jgi:hypothetical protein
VAWSPFLRICAAALALSTVSFAVGLAGDLSAPPPLSGVSVVVRIPPELPADSPRAAPLPPLPRTAAAQAQPPRISHEIERMEAESVAPSTPLLIMMADHELAHATPPSITYAGAEDPFS